MSKPEFDRLIEGEEKRLGKEAVAGVKRAHGNARYRRDWAPILKELAALGADRAATKSAAEGKPNG